VEPSAEHVVHRPVDGLADDVPAGHLEAAQNAHQRNVGSRRVAAAVDVAPQPLDLEGIGAHDVASEDVLDHADDGARPEGRDEDLAQPFDSIVRA